MKPDLKKQTPLLLVYHQDCVDGLASAWVSTKMTAGSENVVYLPYGHHDLAKAEQAIFDTLETIPGAVVFFADVAPSREFLTALRQPESRASQIIVADHHASAAEDLKAFPKLVETIFSDTPSLFICVNPEQPSAASMLWDRFFSGETPPAFLQMIAKMDIGRDLKTEEDFAAAALIDSKDISGIEAAFKSFDDLATLTLDDMVRMGRTILTDQEKRIAQLDENIMYASMRLGPGEAPVWVPAVNADVHSFGRGISEYLCAKGAKTGANLGMAWTLQGNGTVSVSLRTDGTPDARKVAEYLCAQTGARGGGHATSAAVHFSSLASFANSIRLVTQAEMSRPQKPALRFPSA
jgi:hypothetical protein